MAEEGLNGGKGRPTLAERFHERRIRVETMERRLRVATAGAIAFLVGGAIFVALRGVHASGVYLGGSAQGISSIPEPMFIASLVLIAVGIAYMLAGATLASPSVAIPSSIVIIGGIGLYTGAFGSVIGGLNFFELLPSWSRWTLRGLLAASAVLSALAIGDGVRLRAQAAPADVLATGEHRAEPESEAAAPEAADRAARLALLVAFSLLFGGYFLVLRAASPTLGGLNDFGLLIGALLSALAIVVYPILTVAAVDFAEWGEMASDFVIGRVERVRAAWVTPFAALCAVGLAVYAYSLILPGRGLLSASRIVHTLGALLIVVVLLGAVIAGGRFTGVARRDWPPTLNFAVLAAVAAVATVVVPPIAGHFSGELSIRPSHALVQDGRYAPGADVVTMASTGQTPFSVLVPRGWIQHPTDKEVLANDYLGGQQQVIVAYLPQANLQAADTGFKITPTGPAVADGQWQMQPGTSTDFRLADVWIRPAPLSVGGGDYLLLGRSNLADSAASASVFEAMAASFTPAGSPLASAPPAEESKADRVPLDVKDHTYAYGIAIEVGLSLLLLLLVRQVGRRAPIRLVGAALLFGLVTLFGAAFGLDSIGRVVFGPATHLSALGERGLEFSLAVACLAALLGRRWAPPRWEWQRRMNRRLPETVILLVGVTFLLDGTGRLYDGMLRAGRVPVTAAILVLVASAWDIVMSGESMTNEGTPLLPRVTRVLAFFGYSILLSGMVLFYTAQKTVVGGRAVESLFEPETITQGGLFRLALPLVLLLLLLKLFGSTGPRTGEPVGAAGGDSGHAEPEPVMAMTGEE